MIQVENEYGSYGEDKAYVSDIRDCLRGIYGPQMTLFQCDWASNFTKNGLDDLIWTMNFGTGANIDQQFRRLGELRPDAPKMCSEFWSGWFDKWGARHETRPAKAMVDGMDEMLSKGISFSLYMTHGGTSFGHWAGANSPGFAPDVTSYDYDAPINEYGQDTPKYDELRRMMQRHADKALPAVPRPAAPLISVPRFELNDFVPLTAGIAATDSTGGLKTFEEMDMGWGTMVYATTLPDIQAPSVLTADIHDYGQVFVNDTYVGKIDRVRGQRALALPPVRRGDRLTVVVEAMGRINFGRAIKDFKGIVSDVAVTATVDGCETTWKPRQWTKQCIPDDYATARQAFSRPLQPSPYGTRGYYRGTFQLKRVGDTFLNLETWGKGQLYVNGHAMGRFWSIGPQQTLYVPGCWLKKGQNEVIVLDIAGPRERVVWGQDRPELNKLQLERPNKHDNIGDRPDLSTATPVGSGRFSAGNGWQTVNLDKPAKGRYLVVECLSTQQAGDRVAIAELYLRGQNGRRLSREAWTTRYADSEDDSGNHTGDKVFDLQESTYWQTEQGTACPHLLVIDLGSLQTVSALDYLPRAEQGTPGAVGDYKLYLLR